MDRPSLTTISPAPEPDEFDEFWADTISDPQYNITIIEPGATHPRMMRSNAPVGYDTLMLFINSPNVVRVGLRALYGQEAHLYSLGFTNGDDASRALFDAAPVNDHGVELCSRHDMDATVRGPLVIVTRDAIDPRDMHAEMVAADAETMPEIERDHIRTIGPAADREWARIDEALQGHMIPALASTAPTMERIMWLVRTLLIGIDTDIISHAAFSELCVKKPVLAQAVAALWSTQAMHFAGMIPEVPEGDVRDDPPKVPKPAGFSDRYGQVIH